MSSGRFWPCLQSSDDRSVFAFLSGCEHRPAGGIEQRLHLREGRCHPFGSLLLLVGLAAAGRPEGASQE